MVTRATPTQFPCPTCELDYARKHCMDTRCQMYFCTVDHTEFAIGWSVGTEGKSSGWVVTRTRRVYPKEPAMPVDPWPAPKNSF